MSSIEANRDLIRHGYAAFAAGDLATLERMFHPDVVWHEPGSNPLSGVYKGWNEVVGLLTSYLQRSNGTFAAELSDVLASETRAISVAWLRAERDGRRLDQGDHLLCEIGVDGRISEARVLYHDQAAVDAFWA